MGYQRKKASEEYFGFKKLGFATYREYLESKLWKFLRETILERDDYACQLCPCEAKEVHHISYKESVMRGTRPAMLVSLCSRCHHKVHFSGTKKRTTKQAVKTLMWKLFRAECGRDIGLGIKNRIRVNRDLQETLEAKTPPFFKKDGTVKKAYR